MEHLFVVHFCRNVLDSISEEICNEGKIGRAFGEGALCNVQMCILRDTDMSESPLQSSSHL